MQKTECYSRQEQRKIRNHDIMCAKEKEAAAQQTFTFLAPLTNEQPCVAGRNITLINEDLSALCLSAITHTIILLLFFSDKEESLQQASCVLLP